MKKQIIKLFTIALFAAIGLQSCSVEYRDKRRHEREGRHDHDHDHDDHHNYNNTRTGY